MATDQQIEQEIQAKGLTAPRVTPADIEASILDVFYFTAAQGAMGECIEKKYGNRTPGEMVLVEQFEYPQPLALLTFCVVLMRNGYTVTGESACASPENFDEEVGRKIARQNAVAKIWPLLGYQLRSKLTVEN